MNKVLKGFLVLLLGISLYGCYSSNPYLQMKGAAGAENKKIYEIMGWVLTANPQADAYDAFNRKDYRFYAIKLHHRYSIPVYERDCPHWRAGGSRDKVISTRVKYVEGAGYGAETYEHRKLDSIARLYIKDFNRTLHFYLLENSKFECTS